MAEIRKHNPDSGNAIAQALRAALGENVRPRVPGEPAEKTTAAPAVETHTTTYTFSVHTQVVVTDDPEA